MGPVMGPVSAQLPHSEPGLQGEEDGSLAFCSVALAALALRGAVWSDHPGGCEWEGPGGLEPLEGWPPGVRVSDQSLHILLLVVTRGEGPPWHVAASWSAILGCPPESGEGGRLETGRDNPSHERGQRSSMSLCWGMGVQSWTYSTGFSSCRKFLGSPALLPVQLILPVPLR